MKYQSKNSDQENVEHVEQMLSELILGLDSRSAHSRHSSTNFMNLYNITIFKKCFIYLLVCLYGNSYIGTIISTKLNSDIYVKALRSKHHEKHAFSQVSPYSCDSLMHIASLHVNL